MALDRRPSEERLESLFDDVFVEALASRLRRDFHKFQDDVADAIQLGFEKLVAKLLRDEDVENPPGYVTAVAVSQMKLVARRANRNVSLDKLMADDESAPFEPADEGWTVEERALVDAVYSDLKKHVETWETDNVRVVTLLYLEAAYNREPLTSEEAGEIASDILGAPVDASFARTWKHRGFKRLSKYLSHSDLTDKG